MNKETTKTKRLHLLPDADDPDVVLVVMDDSETDGLPVIPTAGAFSYWTHPSRPAPRAS